MEDTLEIVKTFKSSANNRISLSDVSAYLRPVQVSLNDARAMAKWRKAAFSSFLTWVQPDENDMLLWLQDYSLRDNDIIFIIEMHTGELVGQLSIYNIDSLLKQAEFGRTVRDSDSRFKGIMTSAARALLDWGFTYLYLKAILLEVFSDNYPAIALYKRIGFQIVEHMSVKKQKIQDGVIRWSKLSSPPHLGDEMLPDCRRLYRMLLTENNFFVEITEKMAFRIKRATIEDQKGIFDFIQHAWKERSSYQIPHRWQWLYINNPYRIHDGRLPVWIVCDGDRIVGYTAAMVVPLQIGSQIYTAGWSVNTLVLPEYREKKLGYHLQKANQEAWPVFVSLSMTSPNRRIKMKLGGVAGPKVSNLSFRFHYSGEKLSLALEQLWRKYFPRLSVKRRPTYLLGNWLAKILNAKLTVKQYSDYFKPKPITVEQDSMIQEIDRFDEALDAELEEFMRPYSVAVLRTSRYLNWKFVDQPHMDYRLFLARSRGKVKGYIVLRSGRPPLENHYGVIAEIITNYEDTTTFAHLLSFSIKHFHREKVEQVIVSTTVSEWRELLLQFGFQETGETVPVIHCSDKMLQKDVLEDGARWLLSRGDHDWDQFPSKM